MFARGYVVVLVFVGLFFVASSVFASSEIEIENNGLLPYYVQFADGTMRMGGVLESADVRVQHTFEQLNAYSVLVTKESAETLALNPSVALIEPVPEHALQVQSTFDAVDVTTQEVPWNVTQLQANALWLGTNSGIKEIGASMKICVIDSGFYTAHEDLSRINAGGVSLIADEGWREDGLGHGTHVAGTINAQHNRVGVVGVLPGSAELFIVKIFNNSGQWVAGQSNLVEAVYACADAGANIISMSLGSNSWSTIERNAIDDLYRNHNILLFGAAGNGGDADRFYPANYSTVIAVGGLNEAGNHAGFSQYPNTGYITVEPQNNEWDVVEIAAGGDFVLSTNSADPQSYNYRTGTSMATPAAAASAAMVWDLCNRDETAPLNNQEIRALLRDSARDLQSGPSGALGYDTSTGWGIIQVVDAYQLSQSRHPMNCADIGVPMAVTMGVQQTSIAGASGLLVAAIGLLVITMVAVLRHRPN